MSISLTVRASLAALLLCSPLEAKAYMIAGIGLQSCGSWTAARDRGAAAFEMQWVIGYLSGVAFAGQLLLQSGYLNPLDPLDGTDVEAVFAWIDNYCRAKPLDQLETAAGAFGFRAPAFDASSDVAVNALQFRGSFCHREDCV